MNDIYPCIQVTMGGGVLASFLASPDGSFTDGIYTFRLPKYRDKVRVEYTYADGSSYCIQWENAGYDGNKRRFVVGDADFRHINKLAYKEQMAAIVGQQQQLSS